MKLTVVEHLDTPRGTLEEVLKHADDYDQVVIMASKGDDAPKIWHSNMRRSVVCWFSMLFNDYVNREIL